MYVRTWCAYTYKNKSRFPSAFSRQSFGHTDQKNKKERRYLANVKRNGVGCENEVQKLAAVNTSSLFPTSEHTWKYQPFRFPPFFLFLMFGPLIPYVSLKFEERHVFSFNTRMVNNAFLSI